LIEQSIISYILFREKLVGKILFFLSRYIIVLSTASKSSFFNSFLCSSVR
jgi:hypothetical protein